MGVFSLLVLYQAIREREKEDKGGKEEPKRWWNIVIILIALTAYVISLEKIVFSWIPFYSWALWLNSSIHNFGELPFWVH